MTNELTGYQRGKMVFSPRHMLCEEVACMYSDIRGKRNTLLTNNSF
ncbi:hypothetical protein SAMN05444165_0394 [Paraburkholderia phenazinium]|jgi:hypothetical protein|uniref:Uncharacterized protein n=1 Tax=Paraburkholderia phenazinium TaxID=60549 RepID=A0A1N6FUC6_9BURK|nr:hypothetical protein SAMN05444165_0394 [Paraburkholderia phenazinium]